MFTLIINCHPDLYGGGFLWHLQSMVPELYTLVWKGRGMRMHEHHNPQSLHCFFSRPTNLIFLLAWIILFPHSLCCDFSKLKLETLYIVSPSFVLITPTRLPMPSLHKNRIIISSLSFHYLKSITIYQKKSSLESPIHFIWER